MSEAEKNEILIGNKQAQIEILDYITESLCSKELNGSGRGFIRRNRNRLEKEIQNLKNGH